MAVEKELTSWPESGQRTRRWFSLEDAATALQSPDIAAIVAKVKQLGA
jgi:hypothetical protein